MAPKKNKKNKKQNVPTTNDDDWDILNEFSSTSQNDTKEVETTEEKEVTTTTETSTDAAAAYLAELGISSANGANEDKKKDKKKKKGKKKASQPVDEKKPSAAAKLLLQRQAELKAEQERLEREKEEEERKAAEEEHLRQVEEKKRLEAIQKKKDAKKARIQRMKEEGTYMTKAEKQRAAKAKAALERMQAAGITIGSERTEKKVVYTNKKNKKQSKPQLTEQLKPSDVEEVKNETAEVPQESVAEEKPDKDEGPSWDDSDDDAWDSIDISEKLEEAVSASTIDGTSAENNEEVEDLLVIEQKKEKERLRLQGLAIKKREEEARLEETHLAEEERMKSKAQLELEHRKREAAERRREREEKARAEISTDRLRSPICCIMGHVDTGKTKLLDNIRRTNVQDGEAGGITQQIGATFFPVDALKKKTERLQAAEPFENKLPGLLVIDTPGHESFTNLRSRGSSLCDIAILVVDIMHGLEPQTLESLRLLRQKKAPFVVALNKIDRCYGWKAYPDSPFLETLEKQNDSTRQEFEDRAQKIMVEFAEQGLNAELYWRNQDLGRVVSFIPTSAITGEGVPDLLMMLIKLTQQRMAQSLAYVDILQCTVLEVKVIEGLGTTIDTILVNGKLNEGDKIVVCTLEGPVVTTIRSLLTPHPMKEIRVKGEYLHHATIEAAMGVKICAPGLEKAVAGTQIYVVGPDDEEEELKESVMSDLTSILDSVNATKRGVIVQASTLGALEALLEFLRTCDPPIPVSGVNIGPVHKKDVVRASIQLEHQKEYAVILAFDVKVHADATELAKETGVTIFTAEIIYHLFDKFTAYMEKIQSERREACRDIAVFPVVCKISPNHIFNKKDPIIVGIDVEEGILKVGTPLVIPTLGMLKVGRVASIERDHKEVDCARKGSSVAVRIDNESNVMYGRHFDHKNKLYSKLSRESIDALKENFKNDLTTEDWRLVIRLKKVFDII